MIIGACIRMWESGQARQFRTRGISPDDDNHDMHLARLRPGAGAGQERSALPGGRAQRLSLRRPARADGRTGGELRAAERIRA